MPPANDSIAKRTATVASRAMLAAAAAVVAVLLAFVLKDRRFRGNALQVGSGIVLGLLVVAGWYVSGHLGFGENPETLENVYFATNTRTIESLSFVAPLAYSLELLLLWTLLIAIGWVFLRERALMLVRYVRQPVLIAFSTASSEAAMPKLFEQLDRFGVPRRISGLMIPLGYSFNLDGSMMYASFATIFIAQAYGIHLSAMQQILILLTLPVTFLTLGLFVFVINGLMFWAVADLVHGFRVASFGSAVLAAFAYSVISWALSALLIRR